VRSRGFTLLEVVIVGAIVAILAAIAYPSYINSVQKSRRSEATAALLGAASQLERFSTEKGSYAAATLGTGAGAVVDEPGRYDLHHSGGTGGNTSERPVWHVHL
jgi:type IV pilus assembly protein PilE